MKQRNTASLTLISHLFNYSTLLLMCKCFSHLMNALWSTLFVQINKENKDTFSHLCVCIWQRRFMDIQSFLSNPSPRRHSWSVCHLWAWLCSISTSPPTRPWRSAPTPCSGCRDTASLPAPSTRFPCARSSPTLRPSTSAASLSRWASPEPPACWRFVFSSNLLDFISVLRICSTAFNFDLLEGVKLRARFLYKPSLLDQSEHGMSCCCSNILSSLILILFAVFSSASFFYGFIFFSPICRASSAKTILRKWRFRCSSWCMALVPLKTKVERTSSCLMGKQRYSSLSLSAAVCQMFTCLSGGFDRLSLVYCVIVSCWGARGRKAGRLGAASSSHWFSFLTQHSTKDSLEHSRHLWLHFSLSLLYSLIYLPTALSLLPLSALQPEGAARGARGGGAALLRGGGTLPAFPADDSHKQRAR